MSKTYLLLLKFQVLREGSIVIASFVEQPVCSNFKMHSVLILIFFYFNWLQLIQKSIWKSHFFLKFEVLRERSSVIASFVERPVYNVLKIYSVLALFVLSCFVKIYQKCMYKSLLFLKF